MENPIHMRVKAEANYMIETGKTIREIAEVYGVSKSTVHKDLHERLINVDPKKYEKIESILKQHIDVRHIRGGESTKNKYKNK